MMRMRIRSWPSAGAVGKRKSGPRARSTNSRPSKQLPAIRLVDGVTPAKDQRRQRTATPDLPASPCSGAAGFRPAPCPLAAPCAAANPSRLRRASPAQIFTPPRRPPATRDWWLIRDTPASMLDLGRSGGHDLARGRSSPRPGRGIGYVMCMQPAAWPEPDPQIAAAIAAKYPGKRPRPLAVQVRDRLGQWLGDEQFAAAFGVRGKPGWSPSRLALVTVLQRAENLADRAGGRGGADPDRLAVPAGPAAWRPGL